MARMSNVLAAARGIISEEDYDAVSQMLDADSYKDKSSLSESLEGLFGWDPLTHHDRLYLESAFKDVLSKAPDSMKENLSSMKDEIIDATLASKESTDEEYLYQLLIANVAAETGWTCKEEVVDMTSTIFDEVCGPSYTNTEGEENDEPEEEPVEEDENESEDFDDEIDFSVF